MKKLKIVLSVLMVAMIVIFASCRTKTTSQVVTGLKASFDTMVYYDTLTKGWEDPCDPPKDCPYVPYQEFTFPMGQPLPYGGPYGYPHIEITNYCNATDDFWWVLAEKSQYADISELKPWGETTGEAWFPVGTPKIYQPNRHPTAWVIYRVGMRRWQSGNPCGYYHYYKNIKINIVSEVS